MVFHCLTLDSNSSPSQLLSGASRSHYGASWGHLFFIPDCSHGRKSEDLNSLDYHHLGYLTSEDMNIKTTRYILQHRNMYSTYQYLPLVLPIGQDGAHLKFALFFFLEWNSASFFYVTRASHLPWLCQGVTSQLPDPIKVEGDFSASMCLDSVQLIS